MMRTRDALIMAAVALLVIGCRADREVFDEGATLEAPAEVQEAPAWPQEPQPIGPATTTDTVPTDPFGQPRMDPADTLQAPEPNR
jgi:hypothetical protein